MKINKVDYEKKFGTHLLVMLGDCWKAAQVAMEKNGGGYTMTQPFARFLDSISPAPPISQDKKTAKEVLNDACKEYRQKDFQYALQNCLPSWIHRIVDEAMEEYAEQFKSAPSLSQELMEYMESHFRSEIIYFEGQIPFSNGKHKEEYRKKKEKISLLLAELTKTN